MLRRLYSKYSFHKNRLRIVKYRALGARIGEGVTCYGRFTIINPAGLTMGAGCTINEGVHIDCMADVTIGQGVRLSTNAQLHTGRLILESFPRIHSDAAIVIKDNVWIASSVVILAGVTIHENSVIAAGSVVNKDVPANTLVGGVPAKVLKTLEK